MAVSSLAGLVGVPGRTAYSATKFAMTGFFEALRAELKSSGVSVTTAYPGVVATSIRHRGYNARASRPAQRAEGRRRDERGGMRAADHRRHEARRREVVMTAKGKLGRFVKLIAPGMVESMALAALKDEVEAATDARHRRRLRPGSGAGATWCPPAARCWTWPAAAAATCAGSQLEAIR